MHLAPIDMIIFVGYFLGIIALGAYASRKAGVTKRDYFLAGDKLPWWMVGGSIVAANISSHHFIGVIGTAYARGFVAMCIEWAAILIGFNALLWIFLPFYLRNGFYTMPEFLKMRFGSGARLVYGVLILVIYIFVEISAVLYLGALALHSLFGLPLMVSIIALALFTGLYTIFGGLRAVVWTEMFQLVVLIAGGLALSFATLHKVGGWSGLMATSENWHLIMPATDPDFPWTSYFGSFLCISVFYCAANQFIVQRTLAAKDEWHARMGVVFTDYLKFLMPLIIVVPGLLAPQLFPNLEKPDMAFPTLVQNLLPHGLVGLVMAGLIAAVMSHLSGAVNSCTTILTMDFYLPYINTRASESQAVRFGKIMGAAIILLGILWATVLLKHSDKPIFIYLMNAYGYVTPGIATMFILGIMWKRTTHAGALAAGLLTIPLTLMFETWASRLPNIAAIFGPNAVEQAKIWVPYITPFGTRTGIVFWLCMLTAVVVSLFTTPKSPEALKSLIWNMDSLRLPKEMREKMGGLKSPALWWAIITAIVLYMYIRYW
jgi:solute:Na+ symporter, SSS family